MSEPQPEGKPFVISKWLVWEAWRRVKANRGAEGVDEESIQAFEANLRGNLYKVWNRMSSGSYMPPPVRAVQIPKKGSGVRVLGVLPDLEHRRCVLDRCPTNVITPRCSVSPRRKILALSDVADIAHGHGPAAAASHLAHTSAGPERDYRPAR